MQLLNQVIIKRPGQEDAFIQLLQGDLSAIPKEHAADILIISAYPGSYIPVPKTLIAALDDKGLSVDQMSRHKAIDLRDQLGCWLSQPLNPAQQELFNFKKILCFEPWHQSTEKATVVGNIFRCINTFAFNENNNVIAMPVLASGQQKVAYEQMLPALLDASIFWMENGLPINCIKLVLYADAQAQIAGPVFMRAKEQNELKQSLRDGNVTGVYALNLLKSKKQELLPGEETMQIVASEINELAQKETSQGTTQPDRQNAPAASGSPVFPQRPPQSGSGDLPDSVIPPVRTAVVKEKGTAIPVDSQPVFPPLPAVNAPYDYFISYAHTHSAIVDAFVNNLTTENKQLNIFYDKSSIPAGGLWIKQISDAIQKAKRILIFLSPDYSNSPVCWDEFQCAKLMEYNSRKPMIQTIYLYNDTAMPPIMGIYSWADGREGDKGKLQQIAAQLLKELAAP